MRYLPDGNIQFVGRQDGQVKIRGFRIELKEVETVIREFPGIKDATVQAFDEDGGGKFIAAYIVSDEQVDIEALNNFILDQKPPYMVPAVTMQIDAIPLNQNQKVNKKALPKPEKKAVEVEVESNVPMNVLEKEIHDIIAGIINTEEFGVTTVLGYVGLTSIMAIKLAIQINKRFGVTLNSKALAKTGSVQSIENEILTALMSGGATQQQAAEAKHADMSNIPLSYAQMGVYVDCMKQPESTIYNTPVIARFPKDVDINLLIKAWRRSSRRIPCCRLISEAQVPTSSRLLTSTNLSRLPRASMKEEDGPIQTGIRQAVQFEARPALPHGDCHHRAMGLSDDGYPSPRGGRWFLRRAPGTAVRPAQRQGD